MRSGRVRGTKGPIRRCHYAGAFKRKVVSEAARTLSFQIQHDFGVDEQTQWNGTARRISFTGPKKGRHHDKDVTGFIQTQREGGLPMSTEIILAKAREVSNIRGIVRTQFKASRGWVTRFLK